MSRTSDAHLVRERRSLARTDEVQHAQPLSRSASNPKCAASVVAVTVRAMHGAACGPWDVEATLVPLEPRRVQLARPHSTHRRMGLRLLLSTTYYPSQAAPC
jgi:hypothetical protein